MARIDRPTVRGPKIKEPGQDPQVKEPPEKKKDEEKLDEGLKETFPASDPPSASREPTRDLDEHPGARGHKTR